MTVAGPSAGNVLDGMVDYIQYLLSLLSSRFWHLWYSV